MAFFTEPYPFFHRDKQLIYIAGMILVISFLFEYLLEPFNVNRSEHYYPYWIICLIHAANATVIYLGSGWIFSRFINEDDWKVYKEVFFLAAVVFLIGTGSFGVREFIYNNPDNVSLEYFSEEVKNTYLNGFVIAFMITVLNFRLFDRRNRQRADAMKPVHNEKREEFPSLTIETNLVSDNFELQPSKLICIKSDGNYLEFYTQNGSGYQKQLKRMTLKSADAQLSEYPFIIKTHRAYMVNINKIKNVSGNAQGYELDLEHLNFCIPVSRGHIQAFNNAFS